VSTSTRWNFAFVLCCHSNETQAMHRLQICPTRGHPVPSPKLHPGQCSSVGMRPRTDTHRQTRVTTMHFVSSMTHEKC